MVIRICVSVMVIVLKSTLNIGFILEPPRFAVVFKKSVINKLIEIGCGVVDYFSINRLLNILLDLVKHILLELVDEVTEVFLDEFLQYLSSRKHRKEGLGYHEKSLCYNWLCLNFVETQKQELCEDRCMREMVRVAVEDCHCVTES